MKKKLKPVDLEKAMNDIKTLLLDTHNIQEVKQFYTYTGEEIKHSSVLATSFNIKESVSRTAMKHHREQNRTLLDVILLKTFQLGYSQAMIINDNDDMKKLFMEIGMKTIENLSKEQAKLKKKL